MLRKMRLLVVILGLSVVAVQNAAADLWVLQINDGAAPISTFSTALIVKKFADTGGAPLTTIPLPTTASGSNNPITVRGSSTTESFMNLSTNGQYLTLGGYGVDPGTVNNPDASATTPRVVGRIEISSGTVDTSTKFSDSTFATSSFRSVASTNGIDLWMGGNSNTGSDNGGARYATFGSTTSIQLSSARQRARCENL